MTIDRKSTLIGHILSLVLWIRAANPVTFGMLA